MQFTSNHVLTSASHMKFCILLVCQVLKALLESKMLAMTWRVAYVKESNAPCFGLLEFTALHNALLVLTLFLTLALNLGDQPAYLDRNGLSLFIQVLSFVMYRE